MLSMLKDEFKNTTNQVPMKNMTINLKYIIKKWFLIFYDCWSRVFLFKSEPICISLETCVLKGASKLLSSFQFVLPQPARAKFRLNSTSYMCSIMCIQYYEKKEKKKLVFNTSGIKYTNTYTIRLSEYKMSNDHFYIHHTQVMYEIHCI